MKTFHRAALLKMTDIALKDLTSSFRSAFSVIFMFGLPLLVTGMFYFMFGNQDGGQDLEVAVTHVLVVNLDTGSPELSQGFAAAAGGAPFNALGETIVATLKDTRFGDLIAVTEVADRAAAQAAVDRQEAAVAVIVPADFSARFAAARQPAEVELYSDPTLTLGPGLVKSLLQPLLDSISGAQIAMRVALQSGTEAGTPPDPQVLGRILEQYLAGLAQAETTPALIDLKTPESASQPESVLSTILGPIMGGMLIFYAFFTGTATAQTILKEDEQKTLPRLFTTPTPQSTILAGKFLAVLLTVLVQVVVLLIAARLIFGIEWGGMVSVALVAAGTIAAAATFGIFVNSWIKSTQQAGILFGGILTFSGMIGMIPIFTASASGGENWTQIASLLVPQGWAVRGLFQAMHGAASLEIALTTLALLAWSLVFFVIGAWRFQKRYC